MPAKTLGVSIDPTAPFKICIRLGSVRSSHFSYKIH